MESRLKIKMNSMKLTKSQLKQVIKEELESVLDEGWFSAEPPPSVQGDKDLGWIFAEHKLSAKNLNHPLAKIFLNAAVYAPLCSANEMIIPSASLIISLKS